MFIQVRSHIDRQREDALTTTESNLRTLVRNSTSGVRLPPSGTLQGDNPSFLLS